MNLKYLCILAREGFPMHWMKSQRQLKAPAAWVGFRVRPGARRRLRHFKEDSAVKGRQYHGGMVSETMAVQEVRTSGDVWCMQVLRRDHPMTTDWTSRIK
jgi:hypothetical protein